MNPKFLRLPLPCLALLAGAAPALPAQTVPAPAGDEVVRLSEFQVSTSADKGYRAGNSVSATRIEAAIKDLPFSVNAFTDQFIADVGARDLFDVVRYAPGVTSAAREFNAGNTRFNLRGFDQLSPQRNGFVGTAYIDTVNVQRVEIVKGPASILYGQVQPGGTVNVITKVPGGKRFVAVNQQVGTDNFWRSTLDANLPYGPRFGLRLNGSWENGSEAIDPSEQRTWVMAPTLLVKPTANSSLVVDYQWFRRRETPPVFMKPNIRIEGLATSYTSPDGKTFTPIDFGFGPFFPLPKDFNYVGRHDFRNSDFESVYAEYTVKLGDRWTARANYNWNRRSVRNKLTGVADARIWASGVQQTATAFSARTGNSASTSNGVATVRGANGTFSFDPATGTVTNNLSAGSVFLPRRARLQEEFGQGNAYQAEVAGRQEFDGIKWKPLFGAFYTSNNSRSRQRNLTDFYQPWDLMNPATWVDTPSSFGRASPALLPNGDYNVALIPLTSASISFGRDTAYYTAQSLSLFNDRLLLVGGARYNKAEAAGDNYLVAADPATVAGRNEANNNQWTSVSRTIYQAGGGFKLTPELMAYASYSESFSVDSRFLQFRGEQSSKAAPSLAEGKEAGLKSDFLGGRISASVAVFQVDQFNRVLNFSERVGTQSLTTQLQDTEDRSKGWEFETTLSPLDAWQVYLSWSNIDTKLTKVPVGLEPLLGARPEASVKKLFNVWTRYSFKTGALQGWWIGGGANYTGDKAQRVDNRLLTLPAYTLWDVTVGYDGKCGQRPCNVSLAWKNITDEEYFPANQQRGFPSRVILSFATRF
ncbi:MAG: TonB-dependent receptor plug domain-containing protein [Verrucomicrobia bacterium]|nr:TonB-dependent receptor plug domain-containing protein [Verrucomicrobiota bacterium]